MRSIPFDPLDVGPYILVRLRSREGYAKVSVHQTVAIMIQEVGQKIGRAWIDAPHPILSKGPLAGGKGQEKN